VTRAFVIASAVGLLAIPLYLDIATAIDSLRSEFDVTALVPLFRVTAFGLGYVDMLACLALFSLAAWTAVWLDRPTRATGSVAEVISLTGALVGASAVLLLRQCGARGADRATRDLGRAGLAASADRVGVARRANRADRAVARHRGRGPRQQPVGRRAALLERRAP